MHIINYANGDLTEGTLWTSCQELGETDDAWKQRTGFEFFGSIPGLDIFHREKGLWAIRAKRDPTIILCYNANEMLAVVARVGLEWTARDLVADVAREIADFKTRVSDIAAKSRHAATPSQDF